MSVRRVSNRGGNIIGSFPSLKMKLQIPYESTIERDLLYFLEYDPSVKCYQAQPFVITGSSADGTLHRYIPDFQVTRINCMELVECKPTADMYNAHTQQQLTIGQAWADANQYDFVVITETDLRTGHRLANLKLLWRYSRLSVPPDLTALCIDSLLTQPGGLSLQVLSAQLIDTADVAQTSNSSNAQANLIQAPYLYTLLFQHILCADLEQPLSPSSRIWLSQTIVQGGV